MEEHTGPASIFLFFLVQKMNLYGLGKNKHILDWKQDPLWIIITE